MFTEKIAVYTICGPYALNYEDGEKVFDALRISLRLGRKVHLDFAGVEVVACRWIGGAFGRLVKEGWEADDIRDRVEVVNDGLCGASGRIDRCLLRDVA